MITFLTTCASFSSRYFVASAAVYFGFPLTSFSSLLSNIYSSKIPKILKSISRSSFMSSFKVPCTAVAVAAAAAAAAAATFGWCC
jgi:hypothetical protein